MGGPDRCVRERSPCNILISKNVAVLVFPLFVIKRNLLVNFSLLVLDLYPWAEVCGHWASGKAFEPYVADSDVEDLHVESELCGN